MLNFLFKVFCSGPLPIPTPVSFTSQTTKTGRGVHSKLGKGRGGGGVDKVRHTFFYNVPTFPYEALSDDFLYSYSFFFVFFIVAEGVITPLLCMCLTLITIVKRNELYSCPPPVCTRL